MLIPVAAIDWEAFELRALSSLFFLIGVCKNKLILAYYTLFGFLGRVGGGSSFR